MTTFRRMIGACLMAMIAAAAYAAEPTPAESTGASLGWTSDDPVVVRARQMVREGHLADAEAELGQITDANDARGQMRELIARLRYQYAFTASDLLKRLQQPLPGATFADLERWRESGGVQWRMIDGQPAYFRREPANLFRFCAEAKLRKTPAQPALEAWKLTDHLRDVIGAAQKSGDVQVLPLRHRVNYTLSIPASAPGFKAGALVRVWLPFPQEYRQQRDVKLISTSPADPSIAPVAAGEFPITGSPQRTIYFERRVTDPAKPLSFEAVFEYTSAAYYPVLDDAKARSLPGKYRGGNLGERPPHIVFSPEMKRTVASIIGDESNPLARARKIFHWISNNIAYHAEEEYCLIPSLSARGLAARRGDCGVQSMLFITMCRCAGVPARWQSGWETKPIGSDMHDWAEFYVEPWGWLPADPSYGLQKSEDPKVREFYLGHQDSYRLIVNRDYGAELNPPKPSLRSEPADFQRGEVEIDGRNLYFDQWDYNVEFRVAPESSKF